MDNPCDRSVTKTCLSAPPVASKCLESKWGLNWQARTTDPLVCLSWICPTCSSESAFHSRTVPSVMPPASTLSKPHARDPNRAASFCNLMATTLVRASLATSTRCTIKSACKSKQRRCLLVFVVAGSHRKSCPCPRPLEISSFPHVAIQQQQKKTKGESSRGRGRDLRPGRQSHRRHPMCRRRGAAAWLTMRK